MRGAASVALAALVAVGMSACAFVTPQQTTQSYTPSDGVNGSAGDIQIRNAFVITDGDGIGSLIADLQNTSAADRTVSVAYTSTAGPETRQLLVPAGQLLSVRTVPAVGSPVESRALLLQDITAPLGGLFPVVISQGSKAESLRLPILNGSLPDYATLVPTPTPTPIPTRTKRATPTATDGATPSDTDAPTEGPSDTPSPTTTP